MKATIKLEDGRKFTVDIQIEEEDKSFPQVGDPYYVIQSFGSIRMYHWKQDNLDTIALQTGNIFKTIENAEAHIEYLKAETAINHEIARLNDGWFPDFSIINQEKYIPIYDYEHKELIGFYECTSQIRQKEFYLKSEELTEQLIKTHEKELLIYLGVTT